MNDARLDILQMRLDGIAQDMQETLSRTALSPVAREGADMACALFTVDGELLAMSDAIPLLLGALPGSVAAILDDHPPTQMAAGELYFMNDPFRGGTHLPDITVMAPVFAGGTLVALCASILHHQDLGGLRPGSVPPDATEVYQEGLRLPPLRLGCDGRIAPTMRRLIEANSRAGAAVLGDLRAQIAAARRAARSIGTIVDAIDASTFIVRTRACLDRAQQQAVALLDGLRQGTFVGADGLDPTDRLPDVDVKVRLHIGEGRLVADFDGSTAQVAAPINCVASGPLSAVFYALLSLLPANALRNGGILRVISLELPPASVINAAPPAAVNARMGMVRATTSAVLQALAQATPGRMPAANSGMSYVLVFSGSSADGTPFMSTEIVAGGAGGGPDADGADGISTDVGNAMNMPAEALEQIAPVRLVHARVRSGSGGAGRYRGGHGISRQYLALADGIAVSLRGERFSRVPDGFDGGGSPQPSRASVIRVDGSRVTLSARSTITLNRGDRLLVESSGGAGYGRSAARAGKVG